MSMPSAHATVVIHQSTIAPDVQGLSDRFSDFRIRGESDASFSAKRGVTEQGATTYDDLADKTYDDGLTAYRAGMAAMESDDTGRQFQYAAAIWQQGLNSGDARNYVAMAVLYLYGRGVARDLFSAQSYANGVAVKGNAGGRLVLGLVMRATGDVEKGLREIRTAASAGNRVAENELGVIYESGDGVPEDLAEAKRWYASAAVKGLVAASRNLMRLNGGNEPKTAREQFTDVRQEAEKGDRVAMYELATMYHIGKGTTINYSAALVWYRRSAERQYSRAKNMLGLIFSATNGEQLDPAWMRQIAQTSIPSSSNISADKPLHADILSEEVVEK
ncbi:tetratricopeptide repeat protein [Paraburkholderia sp. 35.1]|uniref:tetratricopeptide repeat protein n=1 Tax=Paraburkholderia sp. 35.1 TaxID=2991058 RepID=UPI003D1BA6D6